MVPFKSSFLSLTPPPAPLLATSQRCLRSSGKHNDLTNVGHTPRHHTFFEMLGNFSFPPSSSAYSAIQLAYQFVTQHLSLPPSRLRITVHSADTATRLLWQRATGWSSSTCDSRIISLGDADNLWSMGDTGPRGYCTELYVDLGEDRGDDRWLEIWNLVLMTQERLPDGSTRPLPHLCVDTGMGLERVASVVQGVASNYDIDLFHPLVDAARDLVVRAAAAPHTHRSQLLAPVSDAALGFLREWRFDAGQPLSASFAVVLDHVRAVAFMYVDGLLPSNTHRGYVLRRILRRALTHGYQLGLTRPFLHSLYPALEAAMGAAYPELTQRRVAVMALMKEEETLFYSTLERGLRTLETHLTRAARRGGAAHAVRGGGVRAVRQLRVPVGCDGDDCCPARVDGGSAGVR